MRVRIAAIVVLVALTGCSRSLARETVDGVECMVTRNGAGRPIAIDCDWGSR